MLQRGLFLLLIVRLITPALVWANDAEAAALQPIAAAIRKFYLAEGAEIEVGSLKVPAAAKNTERLLSPLRTDGSWPDIHYESHDRSAWPAATHVNRMLQLVVAASHDPAGDRARTMAGVHRAFGFWMRYDFQCPNWWYNNIAVPKLFATVAILMGDELLPAERNYLLQTMMPRAKISMTGQNRLWLAGNTLLADVIANDPAGVRLAAGTIWGEITVSTQEGIQPDSSFHQHGAQQQFGNYGLSFAEEIARWNQYLAGTPFAMPAAKTEIFRDYLLHGLSWVVWQGAMDPGACDRQITPNCQREKAVRVTAVLANFARFDPQHAADYLAGVARNQPGAHNDLLGDRYFYRSDALYHRLPKLLLSLKLSSNRVIGAEIVNGENLLGYHTGDGLLLAQTSGDEYQDIFPLWNWNQLPGVTAAQMALPKSSHSFVPVDFVGAASDGIHGVAAMDYARDGVAARKAWFFGNAGVVALGAGITSRLVVPVTTGVNTTRRAGPVTGEGLPDSGQGRVTTPGFVEQGGLRYSFPIAENVTLASSQATGNWKTIFNNSATPKADVAGELFSLNIEHGVHPAGAVYAYEIGPAGKSPGAVIQQNTPALQAVRFADGVTGIVFAVPGTFSQAGVALAVDQACVVILDAAAKKISVAEPTQTLQSLGLIINGAARQIHLPVGGMAGSTVSIAF